MAAPTLDSFLQRHAGMDPIRSAIAETVTAMARAGRQVWSLAQNGVDGTAAVETAVNPDGDTQIQLDVLADRIFLSAARDAPVAFYASEELAEACAIDPKMPLALAVDPLDGSSNVDLDLSFGTIFSILLRSREPVAMRPTRPRAFSSPARASSPPAC